MRDDLDLNFFKQLLEERLAAIQTGRAAQQKEGAPVPLDQSCVGRLSRMDAMQQQAMAQATGQRTEIEAQRLRAALSRWHSGEYGYCVQCDEEIAEGRLRSDPGNLLCIDCARKTKGK
ncbi:MAG: TraR/DksA C4-type zinc finger protein [Desulfuromonadales bacterium]|nr:TraR/DksA C4-type zinc finger protein [Desulfuromonadales bacterium]